MTTKITVDAHAGWPVGVTLIDRYTDGDGKKHVFSTEAGPVAPRTTQDFHVTGSRDLVVREMMRSDAPQELPRPLDFADVVRGLKAGKRFARSGWNGKNMFVFLVPGSHFTVSREPLISVLGEGTEVDYHAHVDIRTATGEIVPWLASQTDVLAEDWIEV
jgi:hypothetical protein